MSFFPGRAWQSSMWRLAGLLLGGAIIGRALLASAWIGIALVALGLLAWHYLRLWRVLRLLRERRRLVAPLGRGVWGELESLLYRRQRESLVRKRKLASILRAYRQVAAAVPDGAVVLERQGLAILWFNDSAARLLGLRYPHDLGARFTNLLRTPRVLEWFNGPDRLEPLLDLAVPGNDSVRLSLRLIAYTEDQWLLVVRDISTLMRLEQVRRDFVANVSHELRTPLTVIHGYLDMLEPDDNPEWAPIIEEMRTQTSRMAQIVEDLLMLSRLEAQSRASDETVIMSSLLRTLEREAQALSRGRQHIHLVDTAQCDLAGSLKELHSAFSNLVSNAVRYTPDGGKITIRWQRRDDGGAMLSVTDTGVGIPAQHIPRITERFYRVSSSRSRDSGGTGLGLSIVKHVLGRHHAQLLIESEVSIGSSFACVFGPGSVREHR
ncbi:MAG: phosphate regulon sensor histidine kinase PhoR [Xanthomonadaceae bacterium]|nr:phosphate regulon sensor histidine kinase PhoR [Xanthomonadaceae bacterium]MDP2184953.1 phosphate regulon sensor histidine kinase PhoR [Xanthomonadales bacterium]MDZ4114449.1 phosphate regulon sensor histidine kinase PhoR [Xanthomonadaceae bacterium]MDZ4378614.1 phosphate regulon sensor histidine kinase PhoR [Xanthomonadaceae bacterium]